MLFYSIMRTVFTSPGHIPEEREWDMVSDNLDEDSSIDTDKEFNSKSMTGSGSQKQSVRR